jgi:hypothetical protein
MSNGLAAQLPAGSEAARRNWLNAGIVFLVLAVVFYRTTPTFADPDIWGHVRFGQDMLRTGALVPAQDPYSYLNGERVWIDNEWLAEIILALLYESAGSTGLILFKVAIGVISAGLLYAFICRAGFNALWGGFLLLPASYLMLLGLTGVRVMLFTHFLFVILMLLLSAAERNRRWLCALPPLFVLWVNLHPGVLAGLACVGVWIVAHLGLQLWRERTGLALLRAPGRDFLLAGLGVAAATLVNPYGVQLPLLLLHGGVGARPEISEFAPIRVTSLEGAVYVLLLAMSIAGWLKTRCPRSLPLLAVFACVAVTPLLAIRHAPLFAAAALVLAGPHIADLWRQWQQGRTDAPPQAWIAGLTFVGGIVLVALGVPNLSCLRIDPIGATPYPVRAVALLKDSGVQGNLIVFFDWGEYALWHVGPQVKVSIDGRRESAYDSAVYWRNFEFQNGAGDWDALLAEGPADLVLVSKKFPAANLMRTRADWALAYEDPLAALFVRRDSPLLGTIRATRVREELSADGAGQCFP